MCYLNVLRGSDTQSSAGEGRGGVVVQYNNDGNKQTTYNKSDSECVVWYEEQNVASPPPSLVQVRPLSGTRRVKDEHEVIFSLFLPALPGQDMTQFLFQVMAWSVSHIINTNIPQRTIFHYNSHNSNYPSFLPSQLYAVVS